MVQVFVALGGNIGNTKEIFQFAIQKMRSLEGVSALQVSQFYRTAPVSPIPQDDFLNAACKFLYEGSPKALLHELKNIQFALGQGPKPQSAPRIIDLDLILFGDLAFQDEELTIPHPRWLERDFVLAPMLDLVESVELQGRQICLRDYLKSSVGGFQDSL